MAHVNHQSVCSVEPALWADSWQRVSTGVVRRAACRSEIPSMFAVRLLGISRRELSSTCIEPSDERMGSVAGRSARSLRSPRAAIGESNLEPRRRSETNGWPVASTVASCTNGERRTKPTICSSRWPITFVASATHDPLSPAGITSRSADTSETTNSLRSST